jgi:amino acid transporter
MFDILYSLEYVVLLAFGFSSDVADLIDEARKPILVSVILVLSFLALGLKMFYYTVMHVWNNVIISGKKLTKREFTRDERQERVTQKRNNMGCSLDKGVITYLATKTLKAQLHWQTSARTSAGCPADFRRWTIMSRRKYYLVHW